MVQVLPTGAEDFRVAFDGGVVDNDDVHVLPPDPEWLVRRSFQACAGELEGVEVDQFVVGDLSAEAAMLHGDSKFVPDRLHYQLASRLAQHGLAGVDVEVVRLKLTAAGQAE